jgi:hypothetical protein
MKEKTELEEAKGKRRRIEQRIIIITLETKVDSFSFIPHVFFMGLVNWSWD